MDPGTEMDFDHILAAHAPMVNASVAFILPVFLDSHYELSISLLGYLEPSLCNTFSSCQN